MSQQLLVNIREAFFNAPGFWQGSLSPKSGNWCKFVESIDKTRTDGYSIDGPFVSQIDELAQQRSGIYLHCEKKGRKRKASERLYTLFELEAHGEVRVINELKTASKDWAVLLWPEIEAYFARQSDSVEVRRQQLLAQIQSLEFELNQRRAELAALDFDLEWGDRQQETDNQ
ncbi:MAG: hypothetical protein SXA11_23185 [Cyanobacteriota bacterium]|nr:hypothetical protein [Cyanobacteriota bacterium]